MGAHTSSIKNWGWAVIRRRKPSLVIESDASTRGWGASCKGARTGGPWSSEERQWHFNCLEAAFHAVKCFVRDRKSITVLLRMDNTTAVAYVLDRLNYLHASAYPRYELSCQRVLNQPASLLHPCFVEACLTVGKAVSCLKVNLPVASLPSFCNVRCL